jgi:hypothetical protein
VQWLDGAGHTQPLTAIPGDYSFPSVSPDGKWLALAAVRGIWVCDLQRGVMRQLTFDDGIGPVWTPDGRYIEYLSIHRRAGDFSLHGLTEPPSPNNCSRAAFCQRSGPSFLPEADWRFT